MISLNPHTLKYVYKDILLIVNNKISKTLNTNYIKKVNDFYRM